MTIDAILPDALRDALALAKLAAVAVLPTTAQDPLPEGTRCLVLLGPCEPDFWEMAQNAPEFLDGAANPMDRLSQRIITPLAEAFNATAIFPFGGPPHAPFVSWALRSNQIWSSQVGLLINQANGLFVSFRGALALSESFAISAPVASSPCYTCMHKPCLSACPVNALGASGDTYDIAACHSFLDTDAGTACMTTGCGVRRVCPLSVPSGRTASQSAFHMKAFHP